MYAYEHLGLSIDAISRAVVTTTLEAYSRDLVVRTSVINSVIRPIPRIQPTRGPITQFSAKSADRLRFIARNLPSGKLFLTATYPANIDVSPARFRSDWRRFREWIERQGASGLMVRETDERGLPHLHLLLQKNVDEHDAAIEWARIVGSNDPSHLKFGVRASPITSQVRLANYLAKPTQKRLPNGWETMGRVWALFGGATVKPLKTLARPAKELSSLTKELYSKSAGRRRNISDQPRTFRVPLPIEDSGALFSIHTDESADSGANQLLS